MAGDEDNWRNCGKFQDELYGKDIKGNPLVLILSVGGSIVSPNEKDTRPVIPLGADAYAEEFYAQRFLDVEFISTAVGEKLK